MKITDLLNRFKNKNKDASDAVEEVEEVNSGTKIKVLLALIIVGFSAYVAYWVQEPGEIKADLLNTQSSTQDSVSTVSTESSETVATDQTALESGFTQEISIAGFNYSPADITIEPGTTVVWTNKDTVPHTVTAPDFTSGTLNSGDSYSHVFANDATIEYSCSFHPQMKGKIIVGTGGVTQQSTMTMGETQATETEQLAAVTTEETTATQSEFHGAAAETQETYLPSSEPSTVTYETASLMNGQNETSEVHSSAVTSGEEQTPENLAKSGPEDLIYLAIFAGILYLNRKKFLSALR
jgi:plastocyanin